jgi:hypothetical protein
MQYVAQLFRFTKDPSWRRWTRASSEFQHCSTANQWKGNLLRSEHVRLMRGPEMNEIKFGGQIEAWQRQLPDLCLVYVWLPESGCFRAPHRDPPY